MPEFIRSGAVSYRTRCLPLTKATAFADCLKANASFTAVHVEESGRAKGEARWFVTFLPSNPDRVAGIYSRQQDARQVRAEDEGRAYLFVADKDGGRLFFWVFNPVSGQTYEVTPESCTCPDEQFRACPGGCKHRRALRVAVAEGRVGRFEKAA